MRYLKVWTNFKTVVRQLDDAEIGRLFLMMLDYAETGEEPEKFVGNERFLWDTAKRDIDMSANRDETNRQNGLKGGRPKTQQNQTEPKETEKTQVEPVKEKKRKEIEIKELERESEREKPQKRFSPPSVDEVRAYCQERGNGIDAEAFVAFYASKGWKVGNSPMKDWRQCVITWEKRGGKNGLQSPKKTVVAQQYEQRDYSQVQDDVVTEQSFDIAERIRQKYGGDIPS